MAFPSGRNRIIIKKMHIDTKGIKAYDKSHQKERNMPNSYFLKDGIVNVVMPLFFGFGDRDR